MRAMALGALAILTLAACGSDAPSDKDVLISLVDGVVVPAYEAAARDADQLDGDARALCAAPGDAALAAARDAWRTARASWLMTRAAPFGPVMDRRSLGLIDWSPTDTADIDRILGEGRSLTAAAVGDTLASDQRGFGAIEHLLFAEGALGNLSGSPAHCAYLTGLTGVVAAETGAIALEWTGGDAYRDYFTGRANVSIFPSDAVAEVVRSQVFLAREIVDVRLASALGLRGEGPDLTMLPGEAADNGLHDLRNELLGMRAVYEGQGAEALGVSALVSPLSEDADGRVRGQFAAALDAIDAVELPLRTALAERPDQVRAVYDRLAELQQTLSVEVVSLLGVSVGFSDTDGDSLR